MAKKGASSDLLPGEIPAGAPAPAANNGPAQEKAPADPSEKATAPAIAPRPAPRKYDLFKHGEVMELIRNEPDKKVRAEFARHVNEILKKHGVDHYASLLLYDNCDSISQFHADQIYEAAKSTDGTKDILLILQSKGGSVEPAYFISKLCTRLAKQKFVVAVPRRAKSAATLIAIGADEIHMGLMSELGPVDPQIQGYPALGLINSLSVVAEAVAKHPESAELFARYLSRTLDIRLLGYFVRVPESAVQYGERLLKRNEAKLPKGSTAHSVADQLVNHYKDHGFVIDVDEATEVLGKLVHLDTPEYRAANEIYGFLDWVEFVLGVMHKKDFWFVGDVESGGAIRDQPKK